MAYLFDHLDLIKKALRRSPFGLITDVDGTISPTAPTPAQAEVSPLCRRYLSILSEKLALVAAISGRPAVVVKNMLRIDRMVCIGNHGLERWSEGQTKLVVEAKEYPEIIKAAVKELSRLLTIDGISIEDKGATATIHYRLCPEPELAKAKIHAALKDLAPAKHLRIMEGKMAINLLPPVSINKGTTTLTLIRDYRLRGGIYLGDEYTDIDAFRAIHNVPGDLAFQGFAIGVTSPEMPAGLVSEADFSLNGVADVERFLQWLSQNVPESG
jgi:trehalose 6-phosphate phosphatase